MFDKVRNMPTQMTVETVGVWYELDFSWELWNLYSNMLFVYKK